MICGHEERPASCRECTRNKTLEEAAKVLENGIGGEGTTPLQDATLGHYARKILALEE